MFSRMVALYLQRGAKGKGGYGYHVSANGMRERKGAYFFFYLTKLEKGG